MSNRLPVFFLLAISAFTACDRDQNTLMPPADEPYRVTVHNHYNALEGEVTAFLSDANGAVVVSRDVPYEDTAVLETAGYTATDKLDLTVVRLTYFEAPGSGVRDTALAISTYTQTPHNAGVHVRNLEFRRAVTLTIKFNNLTSLDSITIADAITFLRPQASNQFTGQYGVVHTGQFWIRVKINGEPNWRYLIFENIQSAQTSVTIDATLLTTIFAKPKRMDMPFSAPWDFQVDGIIDTAARRFFGMGDAQVMPGNAIPVFSRLSVLEPVNNEDFEPTPRPYKGFRLQFRGLGPSPTDFFYIHDGFYDSIPPALSIPSFGVQPVNIANNRFLGTNTFGQYDALVLSRRRTGTPSMTWEVYLPPTTGVASYFLPQIPAALGNRFPFLKNYNFDPAVVARAEKFAIPRSFEAVMQQRYNNHDPFWAARWNYTAVERVY